ncbi:MAG TPA: hypothetical protein VHX44_17850 [Planctomycetota bacterium]|nr:hypothetical protein [Planctomycetota bacterium]
MPVRRWLILLMTSAALAAGEAPLATRPLALSGAALETVDHALISLAQGDTSAVEALPIEAFLDPVARPDAQTSGLSRRWTLSLPAALGRLDGAARAPALHRLDTRYRTLAETQNADDRPRLASAFLPAPTAVSELSHAVDRAFDLGRFGDYLGMAELLGPITPADDARRREVAVQLSGLGPQVDATLRLPLPGSALPSASHSDVPSGQLALRWAVVPGWVLACDPFGQVVWQYRVDRLAQVTTGPGAVLVHDTTGLRALDDHGTVTTLRPLPSGAAILAIAGGCAWFATGDRAWRLGLTDGVLNALTLDAPPLGAPLVRGPQSLWLTARELLLFDQDRLVHRFQHRLPTASGWHLGADGDRPLVVGSDGRTWRLESFTDQLMRLRGIERAELLIQARRYDEALAAIGEPTDDRARQVALRAHLGIAGGHLTAKTATVLTLCRSEQDFALVLLTSMAAGEPLQIGPLRRVIDQLPTTALDADALDHLAAKDSALLLTDQAANLGDDPATWDHACAGAAWTRWRHVAAPVPPPAADGPLVTTDASPLADPRAATNATRQPDGALALGDCLYRLERSLDAISVTCHDRAGVLLWRHRWRPASFLSAPSQSMEVRDDCVLVLEGGLRLSVFDADLGVRRGTFTVDELGSGTTYRLNDLLAIVGPLGVDSTLSLVDERGAGRTIPLPSPARWVVALGSSLLVQGQDGVARLYPAGRVVTLPTALTRSRTAPRATSEGLLLDGSLWHWAK